MPQVLIRIDAGGEWPVVVDDDEALESSDGARWRFVAEVETACKVTRSLRCGCSSIVQAAPWLACECTICGI